LRIVYLLLLCELSPSQPWRHRLGQSKSPSQSLRVWLIPSQSAPYSVFLSFWGEFNLISVSG
uniref:Uncharacterized protein n=1 Tax=Chelonoidis abingdonii TaxID=106734 RepID=A0A8C0JAY9_CHEAB